MKKSELKKKSPEELLNIAAAQFRKAEEYRATTQRIIQKKNTLIATYKSQVVQLTDVVQRQNETLDNLTTMLKKLQTMGNKNER
jgi:hypothetical protein